MSKPQLTVHYHEDAVGVVVAEGVSTGTEVLSIVPADNADIPIGHEVAVKPLSSGDTITKHGKHINIDVAGVLAREMTIDAAGDALIDMIQGTANGCYTSYEAIGHREFSMTKLYRSD